MKRLVIALTVLALGACGSDGGSGNDVASLGNTKQAAAGGPEKDKEKAWLDFARCMRDHGVQMADPEVAGSGDGMVMVRPAGGGTGGTATEVPDDGKLKAADAACRHHIEGLGGGRTRLDDPEMQDKLVKFARCMREQGIDMPDPTSEGGRMAVEIKEIDRDKMDAAHKACESVAPDKLGGRPGLERGK
ncbi:MAG TPA: hypothetical protein VM938_02320 [Acidimicrobiales bacterium]|nr:hypothetical protein [Acidimicrobiales bacterium]